MEIITRIRFFRYFLLGAYFFLLAGALAAVGEEPQEKKAEEELAASVARMSRIGFTWAPDFSPDDRRLSFVTMISGQSQLWTVDVDGGWPIQLTGRPDGVMAAEWSPTMDLIAYLVPPDGGGNYQVYLIEPRAGAMPRRISFGGEETNLLNGWTRDGKGVLFSSNRRDPEAMDTYVYRVETGEIELLTQNERLGSIDDMTADNKMALLWNSLERSSGTFLLVDLESGERWDVMKHAPESLLEDGALSPDGRAVYLITDDGRDMKALVRIELDENGRPGSVSSVAEREDAEVDRYLLSPDGKKVAVVWNAAGLHELAMVDVSSGEVEAAPKLPAETIFEAAYSNDSTRLAMMMAGAAAPTDIWIYDIAARKFHRATQTPHPEVDFSEMVRPELFSLKSHDGLEISGWLYRAPGGRLPGPLAMSLHGGPEVQESPAFRSLYQALLARGISIFAPNIRGSSGFGKKFMSLDDGSLRFDAIADVKACAEALIAKGIASRDRMGVFGMSYGGYLVLAALTEYPDLFQAGADISGIVNFETFFKNTAAWIAAVSKQEYGDPETEADLLKKLSPIHRLERLRVPMVIAHGVNDDNVPISEAEQVVEALKQRGIPYEFLAFEDEGHAIRLEENRVAFEVAIVRLFEKYLKRPMEEGQQD